MTIRRILVPTDFSKASDKALELAVELCRLADAEITLLHVVQPAIVPTEPTAVTQVLSQQESLAKRALEKTAKSLRPRNVTVRQLLRVGSAHQSIVAAADRMKADLIVMGTQGRSGLSHLLLGSVAERVVRLAGCPVLTVGTKVRTGTSPSRRPTRAGAKRRRS